MKYIKATDVLPVEILEIIQEYIDGEYIYIPRKCENHKSWGEKSGIKDTNDFFNIKKSFNIVKNIRNVDDETKELVMSLIQFNINYLIENS